MPDSCSFDTVNHHQTKAAASWDNVNGVSGLSDWGTAEPCELPGALGAQSSVGVQKQQV